MKPDLKEDELHYLWFHQKIHPKLFKTTDDKCIRVIDKGQFNEGAGPDFLNAVIEIGGVIWAGHVEVHVKSSDWFRHNHQFDKNYDNVILHLVVEDDQTVRDIPVMLIDSDSLDHISMGSRKVDLRNLPCATFFHTVPDSFEHSWKNNRLKLKLKHIYQEIQSTNFATSSQLMISKSARYFGLYRNQDNMETLLNSIDLKWLEKNHKERIRIEAVLFGMSGLLKDHMPSSYFKALKEEFQHYKNLFRAEPSLQSHNWEFMRVPPSSFPTLRISQFSHFLTQIDWVNLAYDFPAFKDWKKLIKKSEANFYWKKHSNFGVQTKTKSIRPGASFALRSYLNLFIYSKYFTTTGFDSFFDEIAERFITLPPESNNITRVFKKEGVSIENAFDSQAVLASYKYRCSQKGCIHCEMGRFIFNSQNDVQETRTPYSTVGGN